MLLATCALGVDRWIGDPAWFPHPVVIIGRAIRTMTTRWHERVPHTPALQRRMGFLLAALTTVGAFCVCAALLWLAHRLSPVFAVVLNVWLISTTVAWKGLRNAGRLVFTGLQEVGLSAARESVAMIVGRDTADMDETEVVRATVETMAENIVDAIVSPLFFALMGGAPLAMFYRAANTLDSMVGYKNEKYQYFGYASARLDDILNYIPARLTAMLLHLAVFSCRLPVRQAWRTMRFDAQKHPSPNSGWPESIVAGALGVQLGGRNVYGGVPSFRAYMGKPTRAIAPKDILQTIRLMDVTCIFFMCLTGIGGVLWWRWSGGWF